MSENLIYHLFRKFLSVNEVKSTVIGQPDKILLVRQHNQLGDLLAGVSILRAVKETFPHSHLTLVASPFNYPGLVKNKFIDRLFIFDKKKLYNPFYLLKFINLLRENYDLAIVPVTVSISFTSNLIARLAKAKTRIGAANLDGKPNKSSFFFDRRVVIDWRKHPDSNVAERILDIARPFGINTNDYKSEISFDDNDISAAENFIRSFNNRKWKYLIGLHVGAGKIPNRWSLKKYIEVLNRLNKEFPAFFYLTGSGSDKEEINFIMKNISFEIGLFINRQISEVAALISKSDLFISNDTGIMHVAGTTCTPQISIFGPTNPFNWAPVGKNKFYLWKSDLIDDITTDDVYNLCKSILESKKEKKLAE